jgi:hypothetical protein
VEGQSPIFENFNAPYCFNTSYPSICIGNLLVKVQAIFLEGKNVTSQGGEGGGEGVGEMSPNVTKGEGGSKKSVKSVLYYLNGPLQ